MVNQEQLQKILQELNAQKVQLVAVSKTKPIAAIQQIYDTGHKVFGENRVQELVQKYEKLPKDIEWHLIGHLQTNKVKYIAPFVHLIHSIDSVRLLKEVNKQAAKQNRTINCLLEVHIATENTKHGFEETSLKTCLVANELMTLENVQVIGLMGMASFTNNQAQVRAEFKKLHTLFKAVKPLMPHPKKFTELSMGMSGDYKIAVEEGSTMVRVGSLLFGNRT